MTFPPPKERPQPEDDTEEPLVQAPVEWDTWEEWDSFEDDSWNDEPWDRDESSENW